MNNFITKHYERIRTLIKFTENTKMEVVNTNGIRKILNGDANSFRETHPQISALPNYVFFRVTIGLSHQLFFSPPPLFFF